MLRTRCVALLAVFPVVFAAAWTSASAREAKLAPGQCASATALLQRRVLRDRVPAAALATETAGVLGPGDEAAVDSEDAGSLPTFDLVVVVPSHGRAHVEDRQTIRSSWAQYMDESAANCTPCRNRTVKIIFVVGQEGDKEQMAAEAEASDDLGILPDFRQDRSKGSAEMTQRSIRYALEHFKFKLLLKADLGSWVFMDRLLNLLDRKNLFNINATLPGVYAGHFIQDTGSQNVEWASAMGAGSCGYAAGAGYFLTPDLCEFIAGMGAASEDTSGAPKWGEEYGWAPVPRLVSLPSEDIAVGFWLQAVNHTKVELPVAVHGDACERGSAHGPVVEHLERPMEQMELRWRRYAETGDPCSHHTMERLIAHSGSRRSASGVGAALAGLMQLAESGFRRWPLLGNWHRGGSG